MADQDNLSSAIDDVFNQMYPPSPTGYTQNSPTVVAPLRTMPQPIPPALQAGNVGNPSSSPFIMNAPPSAVANKMDPYPDSLSTNLANIFNPKDYFTAEDKKKLNSFEQGKVKKLLGIAGGMGVTALTAGASLPVQVAGGLAGNEVASMGQGPLGKLFQGQIPTAGDIGNAALSATPALLGKAGSAIAKSNAAKKLASIIDYKQQQIDDLAEKIKTWKAKNTYAQYQYEYPNAEQWDTQKLQTMKSDLNELQKLAARSSGNVTNTQNQSINWRRLIPYVGGGAGMLSIAEILHMMGKI